MAKIFPEMVDVGRPPRMEPALRRGAAREASRNCCAMLNAMLDKRFPKRAAFPGDLSARVQELHDAFFEEVAFLFEIALCRGLQEEPTQSVRNAFSVLMDSDTVHNVHGGHEPWQDWYSVHFRDDWIAQLFDQAHADSVNPSRDPDITAMFFRANALLERIQAIGLASEEPVSLSIMEIMPEEIRLSLQGETVVQKQEPPAQSRPWLLVSENYVVYRYRLADKLGLSDKALSNYERGKRPKDITVWPKPLNPDNRHGKKFYDPFACIPRLLEISGNHPAYATRELAFVSKSWKLRVRSDLSLSA